MAERRTVANLYEDTRELLNEVKSTYDFKSDDQAIKYMCNVLLKDKKFDIVRDYIEHKKAKPGTGE
ncbi:hypothetical protein [Paenibacillus gorillae]|uniref:hypothetical protein n=1 Tax=Paenibacillus gorillae TaxID=1243662 RepID=UPI0005A60DA0|nr:hypothetical protein [Paenibacillus gorillae]